MEKIRLLIADRDREYGRALTRAISGLHSEFQVQQMGVEEARSSAESQGKRAEGNLNFSDQFDLILCDEEDSFYFDSAKAVRLSQRSGCHPEKDGVLYRYAGVSAISAELLFRYRELGGEAVHRGKSGTHPMEIISFYAGAGGCGKTSAAIGIARSLALQKERRILYLSFEEPDATEFYFGKNVSGRGAGELLYYFPQWVDSPETKMTLEPFLCKDEMGVDALPCKEGRNEFLWLNAEEVDLFLASIRETEQYEYVFADLGRELSPSCLQMMARSKLFVFLESEREISPYQNWKAAELLQKIGGEEGKRIQVRNCSCGGRGLSQERRTADFEIPWDPKSFVREGERMCIGIHGSFGKGVERIAEEVERRCEGNG